jgi:hypothetical protein
VRLTEATGGAGPGTALLVRFVRRGAGSSWDGISGFRFCPMTGGTGAPDLARRGLIFGGGGCGGVDDGGDECEEDDVGCEGEGGTTVGSFGTAGSFPPSFSTSGSGSGCGSGEDEDEAEVDGEGDGAPKLRRSVSAMQYRVISWTHSSLPGMTPQALARSSPA